MNASRGLYYRLRLSYEPGDLTRLIEEQVTSSGDRAQPVEGAEREALHFTAEEVRWLHGALGELLELLEREGR